MEASQLKIFLSSFLLLLILSLAAFPSVTIADETAAVVVEGMVYCQSCDRFGSWSLTGAEPIPAAKISVTCKNHKNHVIFYKAFETDGNGYFYAELDGFKMSHNVLDHPLHSCHVKPVSSPLENCNFFSNVNNGLYGSPLRYENKRLFRKDWEVVVYSAGPLAFRPAHCPPETHY